ncbi:MAG: hypothetical protein LBI02_09480 [Opitutaceae bacterium]|nr:hypothetical protein [Opitutaceae bacterium]
MGNGHIDPVWVWPWQEGVSCVRGAFRLALGRMKETPGFCFTANSTLFYEWAATKRQAAVAPVSAARRGMDAPRRPPSSTTPNTVAAPRFRPPRLHRARRPLRPPLSSFRPSSSPRTTTTASPVVMQPKDVPPTPPSSSILPGELGPVASAPRNQAPPPRQPRDRRIPRRKFFGSLKAEA